MVNQVIVSEVDPLDYVILSDQRERRISLEPLLAIASWRFFVASAASLPTLLRMTCAWKYQHAFENALNHDRWLILTPHPAQSMANFARCRVSLDGGKNDRHQIIAASGRVFERG